MSTNPSLDDLSVQELEQLLYRKKRRQRIRRLERLKEDGRVVGTLRLSTLATGSPSPNKPEAITGENIQNLAYDLVNDEFGSDFTTSEGVSGHPPARWRCLANQALLLIEIAVVLGLIAIGISLWTTQAELNRELAQILKDESLALALPTPKATPVIDVVILPGGHKPPVDGRVPEPGEAGDIPAHLLPVINAYSPPPIPTPGPEQARRIQIPAIDVDSPVVQGMYDWEQLKKGVAQRIGSAGPGTTGNMALAGHNDIYGEVFRDLDKLEPGDEIIVSTQRRTYTYLVSDTKVVEPTDVWVLEPTEYPSMTLVSCYPYRVNTKRIAIFADLPSS
jgi:sortase A